MKGSARRPAPGTRELESLLLRAIEHERLSATVYRAALGCTADTALRERWRERLRRTNRNVAIAAALCCELQIDMNRELRDCAVVRKLGAALVAAMTAARDEGAPETMDPVAR